MKRKRRVKDLYPVKKNKPEPTFSVEVWEMILSMVSFKDQVNCRLVCRNWLEIITKLPAFKNKNHLDLDCCDFLENHEPLSTILNSKLKFSSMRVGKRLSFKYFPSMTNFLSRVGETLTHLDISQIEYFESSIFSPDMYRIIIENLYLFKVLYKLTIGYLNNWTATATSTSPGKTTFTKMIEWILNSCRLPVITDDLVKTILETNMNHFQQNIFLKRYKNLIFKKIKNNLASLNEDRYFDEQAVSAKVGDIVKNIEKWIRKADKSRDLSTRINSSVRVLAFRVDSMNDRTIERLFQLVPNVQEFHVIDDNRSFNDKDLRAFQQLTAKITWVHVESEDRIEKYNLHSLEHLEIGAPDKRIEFTKEKVERWITFSPNIESISLYTSTLPQVYVDYITELHIFPLQNNQLQLKPSNLVEFKNLHTLNVSMTYNDNADPDDDSYYNDAKYCFSGHEPVKLKSVKKLKFTYMIYNFCFKCFETLLQSLPNVRDLNFIGDEERDYANCIFQNQPNLEKLRIKWNPTFIPRFQWPEMKKLKSLIIKNKIGGNEVFWMIFGNKLPKLRYLEVEADGCDDLLKLIKTSPSSFMPSLQKVSLLIRKNANSGFNRGFKPKVSKIIQVNGRNVVFEKYRNGI